MRVRMTEVRLSEEGRQWRAQTTAVRVTAEAGTERVDGALRAVRAHARHEYEDGHGEQLVGGGDDDVITESKEHIGHMHLRGERRAVLVAEHEQQLQRGRRGGDADGRREEQVPRRGAEDLPIDGVAEHRAGRREEANVRVRRVGEGEATPLCIARGRAVDGRAEGRERRVAAARRARAIGDRCAVERIVLAQRR
eukprot:2119517-Prymnesium_polylepis.1